SKLSSEGFSIRSGIGGMDTAFVAEYGEADPVIGILGEYDALPGLSQKVKPQREPLADGRPGHGCGHNLLGTAGVGAVLGIKNRIENGELEGTVRYYGCPAEETLVGKVFMARDGVFDDLDGCLTWHPGDVNATWNASSLGMNSVRFTFKGASAHAAASPEQGRSALDAVELMNVGTEYMREHISDKARVHYSIPEGGHEPNIVPDKAVAWYYVRAPEREEVDFIYEWLCDIAEAAAAMTRVEMEERFLSGCYPTLSNRVLADRLLENMVQLGGPGFEEADLDFARQIEETFEESQKRKLKESNLPEEVTDLTLHQEVIEEHYDLGEVSFGSTDVGDVSRIVPLAQFTAATQPLGTAGHSWQATASSGSEIGLKGMFFAAQTLATTMVDLYTESQLIADAREEFEEEMGSKSYAPPLPEGVQPPYDQLD
ncbi:MAG: amidohydrolase, partial [Candidatus Acetothermia bacterium]